MGSVSESWLEKLELVAQQIAQQENCILYDVELVGMGSARVLRIFIDNEKGIGIEECSQVSKALNLRLDDENLVPGEAYSLEVSSPGVDRHLKKKWHFEKVIGQKIYLKLSKPLNTLGVEEKSIALMKQFEDVLKDVVNDELVFEIRSIPVRIPLSYVEKAKVVFEIKTNSKKKK